MNISLIDFSENILHVLTRNPKKSYSLEELAKISFPFSVDFCETANAFFFKEKTMQEY
ncbi:hypothetical protein [Flavobacterium sp. 140616W15]|uniref:hypothetical protein n=1 Tax=Flavobacterium sp. 140616W15 TaxID=2478552 RepID=UPI0013EBD3E6|nr:hypothetical protein [Flavobacterium sp. 140616W15]